MLFQISIPIRSHEETPVSFKFDNITSLRIIATLCFILLLVSSSYSNPFLPPDSLLLHYARTAIIAEYDSARTDIVNYRNTLDENSWTEDWADLLEVSLALAEWADYGDSLRLAPYNRLHDKCLASFLIHLENSSGPQDSAASFFALGTLEGLESTRLEASGSSFSALGHARRSAKYLRESYFLDSTLVDAALGFSLYDYWSSRVLRAITWTPLKKDKRKEAIARMKHVSDNGHYARYLAGVYLAWVNIEEDRYIEAASIADSLLLLIGESRALLEPAGKAYYLAEDWIYARDRYQRLVDSIRNADVFNPVKEIGALNRLGHIAKAQQDWDAVIKYAERAQSLALNEEQQKRKKDDLKRLAKLREKALENIQGENETDR